ncbi:endonuclease/exonuclease/phosphatase family protein [Chitinasiproducens palmae]|uniref:Metal-dependent hydrolase, endonuclease/exonuclease/phosphatase family n=1 Tax=Chitinasiproducens palmae TaxID=1770053 RepID=A0A1H2PM01_9BURK|nr:endonuclease/exonuclease/phosphatase family protein [Chitinasiproducens palmae]SDV46705.1 Metal-dependent hydrolase, endonuclease/exonuclease/phosphatase family [Chitinasiproducens palmae]
MILINWNIQWGRGADGRVDLARTIEHARRLADFDVLCLQEVSRGFDVPETLGGLPGGPSRDQFDELRALLPGFEVVEGIALDLPGRDAEHRRRQFGVAIVSRLPVKEVVRLSLPRPPDGEIETMQRLALEAVLETQDGLLRVVTTHLEYRSARQRLAQVDAIRTHHAEACALPTAADTQAAFAGAPGVERTVICGDFNTRLGEAPYATMLAPLGGEAGFVDAWSEANAGRQRAPTVGCFDREQWPDGSFCCDYVFLSFSMLPRLIACDVDPNSDASDHQPMVLHLNDGHARG